MRPFALPSKRLLQANEATQYQLPYAAELESSTVESQADGEVHLDAPLSVREIPATQRSTVQQSAAPTKRRQRGKKPPAKVTVPPDAKLLVGREEAAAMVSLSVRSIDYLIANKELPFRKIGTRTMIPVSELQRFVRMDHPKRICHLMKGDPHGDSPFS